MRRSKGFMALAASLILSLVILSGCSGSPGSGAVDTSSSGNSNSAAPKGPKELRVAYTGTISTLDPHTGIHGTEHQVLWAIFDSLIRFDANLNLQPGLAEKWEFPDPTTLVLSLRPGLKFHDGTPLDAKAVKWNIERQQDKSAKAVTASEVAIISGMEVVNDTTIKLKLKSPSASILATLTDRAGMMVSPTAVQKYGNDFGRNPVGAGPFVFKEWIEGSHWTLTKNADFWEKGYPKVDTIVFDHFKGNETAMQALKSGEIDFFQGLSAQDTEWVEQSPDFDLNVKPTIKFYSLYVNTYTKPGDNLALRQAISYALDRDTLGEVFGGKGVKAAPGYWPDGYWAKDSKVKFYPYDVNKAKAKLEEAKATGYDGTPVKMTVYSAGDYPRVGEAIQQMLTKAGINVDMMVGDNTAMTQKFDVENCCVLKLTSWTGRTDPDQTATQLFHSGGGYFYPRNVKADAKGDQELNKLIEAARAEYDPKKRAEIYGKAEQRVVDGVINIPLYFLPWNTAIRKNVTGFDANIMGKPIFRTFDFK
jgi:peptide/nickel transport system substrate-binding protein